MPLDTIEEVCEFLEDPTKCSEGELLQAIAALLKLQVQDGTTPVLGIEQGIAPVGCVKDDDGVITGAVFICKTTAEDESSSVIEYLLAGTDGSIVQPYTGEWEPCSDIPKTTCGEPVGDPIEVGEYVYQTDTGTVGDKISWEPVPGQFVISTQGGFNTDNNSVGDNIYREITNPSYASSGNEIFVIRVQSSVFDPGGNIVTDYWLTFKAADVIIDPVAQELRILNGRAGSFYTPCGKAFDQIWNEDNAPAGLETPAPPIGTFSQSQQNSLQVPNYPAVGSLTGIAGTGGDSFFIYDCQYEVVGDPVEVVHTKGCLDEDILECLEELKGAPCWEPSSTTASYQGVSLVATTFEYSNSDNTTDAAALGYQIGIKESGEPDGDEVEVRDLMIEMLASGEPFDVTVTNLGQTATVTWSVTGGTWNPSSGSSGPAGFDDYFDFVATGTPADGSFGKVFSIAVDGFVLGAGGDCGKAVKWTICNDDGTVQIEWRDAITEAVVDPLSILSGDSSKVIAVEQKFDVIEGNQACSTVDSFTTNPGGNISSENNTDVGNGNHRLRWSNQSVAEDQQILDWLNAGYYVTLSVADGETSVLGGPAGFFLESFTPGGSQGVWTDQANGEDPCDLFPGVVFGNGGGERTWTAIDPVGEASETTCTAIQEIKEQQCDGSETYRFVVEDGAGNLIPYTLQGELRNECPAEEVDPCADYPKVIAVDQKYDLIEGAGGVTNTFFHDKATWLGGSGDPTGSASFANDLSYYPFTFQGYEMQSQTEVILPSAITINTPDEYAQFMIDVGFIDNSGAIITASNWIMPTDGAGNFTVFPNSNSGYPPVFEISAGGDEECVSIKEIIEEQCDGSITCRLAQKIDGVLVDYELQGELVNECPEPAPADYTGQLDAIITALGTLDADDDASGLASILAELGNIRTDLTGLDSDDDAAGLAAIVTAVNSTLVELQAIDVNTDEVEALLSALQVSLIAESDQTQVILGDILAKLNQTCAGDPIKVEVCDVPCLKPTGVEGCYEATEEVLTEVPAKLIYVDPSYGGDGWELSSESGQVTGYLAAGVTLEQALPVLFPNATLIQNGDVNNYFVVGDTSTDWDAFNNSSLGNAQNYPIGLATGDDEFFQIADAGTSGNEFIEDLKDSTVTTSETLIVELTAIQYAGCGADGSPDPSTIQWRDSNTLELVPEDQIADCPDQLAGILEKLNEDCDGSPIKVETCPAPGVQRTPTRLVTTADGSVAAGSVAVSIHNHSDTIDAIVAGGAVPPGETVTFGVDAPDTLAAIAYVTNGAELHINTIV